MFLPYIYLNKTNYDGKEADKIREKSIDQEPGKTYKISFETSEDTDSLRISKC